MGKNEQQTTKNKTIKKRKEKNTRYRNNRISVLV
jgi:hypothetical protein